MQSKHIKDIFQDDVRSFSVYDCQRSIPSGIDGFKPAMRKIIYGMLEKFPTQEIKVSLAAAGIQEVSQYHHGSLEGTIVNMAQSFPGSNNVPFLDDIGQFGSRISPSASASRYIFTKLADAFRQLCLRDDDGILKHLEDDGETIEPEWYLPVIPTVLLNGSDGMGTGFATRVFNHNPLHLIECCEEVLKGKRTRTELVPWYRGFSGTITKNGGQTTFTGVFERVNTTTLKITELPVGSFTQRYREVLNDLEDKALIKSYVDNSSEEKTEFVVTAPRETLRATDDELLKMFKLIVRDTENLTVWTENGKLRKFSSTNELLEWFVSYRVTRYEDRRQHLIAQIKIRLERMIERVKFIKFYIANSTWFSKNNKDAITARMMGEGFVNINDLLSIRVLNLTHDQIQAFEAEITSEQQNLAQLESTTKEQMYMNDLSAAKKFFKAQRQFS
jgi:DNA topoisomerase II